MRYREEDFELSHIDKEYEDYWFKVRGPSAKIIEHDNMEMCMVCAPAVVYSASEKLVWVERLFPFNYDVVLSDDSELKEMLAHMIERL